jgi:hypothetical protein
VNHLISTALETWSYQQKFSDLRNFQKNLENLKTQKGQKKYLADVLAWPAH